MRVNGWPRSRRRRGGPFGPNLSRPDPGNSPMNSPKLSRTSLFSGLFLRTFTAIILFALLAMLSGCGGKLVKETSAEPVVERPPLPPVNFPTWFGNPERNFYGTGPWSQAVGSGLGFQDRLVQRTFAQRSMGGFRLARSTGHCWRSNLFWLGSRASLRLKL